MPELPTSAQLGQRSFQDRSQVVRPQLDMSGQQNLTNTLQQVSSNINERLDQSSLQKAKVLYQKRKLEADAAFDKDPDFETHEARYGEMMGKAAEESAKLVRNPRMQEMFKEEISLYQAQGAQQIKARSLAKETEQGVANLDESLTIGRENYLRSVSPVDREFARESMMSSIDFAEANGYIKAPQAQSLRQKAAVDLAIASVKIEPAGKQAKLLREHKGLIDVIPSDVRIQMIKEADNQSQTDVALVMAGGIKNKGGDLTTRLQETDKIGDVKVREMVREQVEEDFAREKRAVAERQYSAYDTLKKNVIAGKTSLEVAKENPDAWNSMSGDQQQAIRSMDTGRGERSDLNVYNKLNQLAATNRNEAYDYYVENAYKLSSADAEKWSDRLAKPAELDGYLTRTERLDVALSEIGIKDKKNEKYKLAQDQLDKDTLAFEKEKGRQPNAEELTKLVNGIADTVAEGFWSDTYGFDLTPEQRKSRQADAKITRFNSLLDEYKAGLSERQNGAPVILTDDEINKLYKVWDNKGRLDDNVQ